MIALPLDEVARLAPGELRSAEGADEVTGLTTDSRNVAPGDLFVAVGRGADFAEDALAAGAAAALVPEDAFAALAAIGRAVRERSPARVVAITGSIAKTSTKDILAALVTPLAKTVAAEGSQNNEIGLPLTLGRLNEDTEVCVAGDGHARHRADRRALRDRPTGDRRHHADRAGAPGAPRDASSGSRRRRRS